MPAREVTAPSAAESFEFVKDRAGIRELLLRSNGLRVLLLQNRVAPVVTFAVLYHVGSRNEAVGYTGSTHLLEHLLFKGTSEFNRESGTAIAAVLEAIGARFNATTWFDRTNYYETIPSDRLEVVVRLEASRMRGSFLRDEDRALEMTVVRNEFERGENSPFQVLYKNTFAAAFREHPYHHPTIGWRSDIEAVPTERLREFYDTFYQPNNATALVVGDFEEEEALRLLAAHFGRIPRSRRPIPAVYTTEPPQEGERRFVVRRVGQVPWCALSWRTVEARHPDTHALAVLANVLGGGITSRLYQRLVEKNLALSVSVVPWQLRDPALFSVFAPVRPGVSPESVEEAIREEAARMVAEGPDEAECEKARTQIEAEVIFDRDSTDQIAASLCEAIAVADWEWYADYPEAIRRVRAEEVQRVAGKYFQDDGLTAGLYLPRGGPGESGGEPDEESAAGPVEVV
jgi:zinc protease